MKQKIKRFSYNQLCVLAIFLAHAQTVLTLAELERGTGLRGKSLGGVLSALSRTTFRSVPLIEPAGTSGVGKGLRWVLNASLLNLDEARTETHRLLKLYRETV
jgi:hypothetical protein